MLSKKIRACSLPLVLLITYSHTLCAQDSLIQFKKGEKLPSPVYGMAYSELNDGLISIGGATFTNHETNYIFKYNTQTGKWLNLKRSYEIDPMVYGSATYLGETYDGVIVHGGISNYRNYVAILPDIILYNLSSFRMTSLGVNPNPANHQSSSFWKDKLYLFGGSTSLKQTKTSRTVEYSQSLFEFDLKTGLINQLPDLPEAKQVDGVIIDDYLYIIGGFNGTPSTRVDRYDLINKSWQKLVDLKEPLSAYAITKSDQYIFYIGDYSKLNQLLVFDTKNLRHHVFKMNFNARFAGAGIVDGNLHVFGGLDPNQINKKVTNQHWYIPVDDILSRIAE
ncbi:MAG: kelch repeat-containing protein [Ekhidna sp.]